jgi:hypothetical protein
VLFFDCYTTHLECTLHTHQLFRLPLLSLLPMQLCLFLFLFSLQFSTATTFSSPYAACLFLFLFSLQFSTATTFSSPYAACLFLFSLQFTNLSSLFSSQSVGFSLYSLVFSSFSFPKIQSYFFFFFFLSLCHNKSQISPLQFPNCRPFLSKSSSEFFYLFGFSLFFFLFSFPFCQPNIISPPI